MMRNQSLSFGDQLMVGEAEKMGGELEEKGGLKKKRKQGLGAFKQALNIKLRLGC